MSSPEIIVFLNGPPYSGKDQAAFALGWPNLKFAEYPKIAAHLFYEDEGVPTMKQVEEKGLKEELVIFKKPRTEKEEMKAAFSAARWILQSPDIAVKLFGYPKEGFSFNEAALKLAKDIIHLKPDMKDLTIRKTYIWMSEKIIKPRGGPDIMGKILIEKLKRNIKGVAISDCGFREEVEAVCRAFPLATKILIRCHRPGKTFQGDSRSYVQGLEHYIDSEFDLNNDGPLGSWRERVRGAVIDEIPVPLILTKFIS